MAFTNIIDIIYPIGSAYQSTSSTSPATLFGGTWNQIKNRFLVGAGDSYKASATGGEATHTLTINEMPSHKHNIRVGTWASALGGLSIACTNIDRNYTPMPTDPAFFTGGGQAHNNLPPYYAVYIWVRTA